jgi:hypothetical protein
MSKNLKISIDYDGCLAKTSDFICEIINYKTESNHTYRDIDGYEYWQRIGKIKEFWKAFDLLDTIGRLSIKPYDDYVFDNLRRINSLVGEFDIVTANNEKSKKSINDWIVYYNNFNKPMIYDIKCIGRKNPAEKLKLDYDIYIDDNPDLATGVKAYPNKFILLANAPWNKDIKNSKNIIRFESWKEIPLLIKRIMK